MIDETDFIKAREIAFTELHPDPHQAGTAALLLADIEGIIDTRPLSNQILYIQYDLSLVYLEQIESALISAGFHLSSKLIYKLKRALYYYTEETQRANNGCPKGDSNCTRKIFINRYKLRDHHCRDHRSEYWRRYL
ncbi:MAG: hypothetical protein GY934_19145 [Gammaproteobacteria bacterium]|nr:hypothetical protein [Gammaproteobacteria bacterium]